MNTSDRVAVASRSFSRNESLREELLSRYKYVSFNDQGLKLESDSLVNFLSGHSKAIIALEELSSSVLAQLPILKVVSKYGVGIDMLDHSAMSRNGIKLGWTGGVNKRSVSEQVISLCINLLRDISFSNKEIINGIWQQHLGRQLTGLTIGIIGCGFVGKDLVSLLKPFRCKILVNDIISYDDFYKKNDIEKVSKDQLLRRSDIVTLHVPLDQSTLNIISERSLSIMKKNSILINCARGKLVDEIALKQSLVKGNIAGAALDVFSTEPPSDQELIELPNFIATPHIGGSSIDAIQAMGMAAIEGLDKNKYIDE
jgi:phosphoglycerate dehydrogenase-like enzyme